MNIVNQPSKCRIIDKAGNVIIDVLPRTEDAVFELPKKELKRVWSFPISIWAKDFKFETEEMLRKCFEKDWECCKVQKFIKNLEEALTVKELLWSYYKQIKETYRHYSSMNPSGDIWAISSNPLTDFINSADLIDGKTLKLSDLDLKFIATCSASIEWKGNPRNPERSLVRYQLMEFLVRLAEDKYLKNKLATSYLEATKMILDQCAPVMNFNAQKWRDERYFNEPCDIVLKYYKPILDHIYARYSVKKVKPGHKKFMCLDELHDLCLQANFFDENFVDRDVNLAFNLSQFLQVDELESDRLFQMSQIEFYEALARISDKLSLPKYGTPQENIGTYDERSKNPLHLKLEASIIELFKNCSDQEFREDYMLSPKSLFADE